MQWRIGDAHDADQRRVRQRRWVDFLSRRQLMAAGKRQDVMVGFERQMGDEVGCFLPVPILEAGIDRA